MTAPTLLVTLLVTGAALLALQGATFLVALKAGKHSVVDTAWGIGIALAALAAFLVSGWLTTGGHGDTTRRALLLTASVLWGLRLAADIGRRNHGKPEDPQYADYVARTSGFIPLPPKRAPKRSAAAAAPGERA